MISTDRVGVSVFNTFFKTDLYFQQDTSMLGSWIYAKLIYPDGPIKDREEVIQSQLHAPQLLQNLSLDIIALLQINICLSV